MVHKLTIYPERKKNQIHREIYGHFAEHLGRCIYGGIYVGENSDIEHTNGMRNDVVEALKELRIPVLRWPGGCFADEYHWRDGVGEKKSRKRMINTHWGGVIEDNSFGTHEYFELCRQLGCKTYINGNLGSGTVQEMSEWVEYMTFDGVSPMAQWRAKNGHEKPWTVDFFGVGNENWGCGGNMTPEYYANEYRRYQTYVRDYQSGRRIQKICGGPNVDDYVWTEQVLRTCFAHPRGSGHGFMDGLSLHYYVHPEGWEIKGSATDFDVRTWYKTLCKALYMDELISRHGEIMDRYDPEKNIAMIVDEWGTWYTCEPGTNPGFLYQQNTMRDALVAAVTLNIFNKHSDRVRMANLAQMVNVLQAVILTEGKHMLKTPTYHVFHMYKEHQGGTLLVDELDVLRIGPDDNAVPNLSESVSMDRNGVIHATIANLSVEEGYELKVTLAEETVRTASAEILTGEMNGKNTFDEPDHIREEAFTRLQVISGEVHLCLPPCSVVSLHLTSGEQQAEKK